MRPGQVYARARIRLMGEEGLTQCVNTLLPRGEIIVIKMDEEDKILFHTDLIYRDFVDIINMVIKKNEKAE